jgi:hypothetical protein
MKAAEQRKKKKEEEEGRSILGAAGHIILTPANQLMGSK